MLFIKVFTVNFIAMKTKYYFLFLLFFFSLTSCSLLELDCKEGQYKYVFTCIYEHGVYHIDHVYHDELFQPKEIIEEGGLAYRCVQNGAFKVSITVYKQYCNETAHDYIYRTWIDVK